MEQVEFTMNVQESDFRAVLFYVEFRSWRMRCFIGFFLGVILLILLSTPFIEGTIFDIIAAVVFPFSLAFLALPIVGILKLARRAVKHINRAQNRTYVISLKGYSTKSNEGSTYITWDKFKHVKETPKYIFLEIKEGGHFVIFKHLLDQSIVASIKDILSRVDFEKLHA